jgi:hypothetical protein
MIFFGSSPNISNKWHWNVTWKIMISTVFDDLPKAIITLFVVIDPIASVPVIIALTNKMEKKQKNQFQILL